MAESVGGCVNYGCWRLIGDKAARQLGGDEPCRRRMAHKQIDDFHAVFYSAPRRDACSKHRFCALIVQPGLETKLSVATRSDQGPPGKATRHLVNVLLGIAAVDAERVQLHDFSGVILV